MSAEPGVFIISLDFELFWGVRDNQTLATYGENIIGARKVIPILLELFLRYDIHSTWATVGLLFNSDKASLVASLPKRKPNYKNQAFNPYVHVDSLGENEDQDPFHYATDLIRLIRSYPNQEIGSHTFSHFYCLEHGQNIDDFRSDLNAAQRAARKLGIFLESLVFPRNQYNAEYLKIGKEFGFKSFRGNPQHFIYTAKNQARDSKLRRALRLLDSYINISGHNCYSIERSCNKHLLNLRASHFLRPFSQNWRRLEPLRLKRINNALEYAARHGLIYHLWWHPHNFGTHINENLNFLERILEHFQKLQNKYSMRSLNMGEVACLQSSMDKKIAAP